MSLYETVQLKIFLYFLQTKQYFLLKEKITFIIEECGLFCQLREKDLISHLNVSLCEEDGTSLSQCDALAKFQKQILLKDLGLLYNLKLLQKGLFPFKSKNYIIIQHYFPEEVLEEIVNSGVVDRAQLPTINILFSRLVALQEDMEHSTSTTYISIMDSVFDLHVSELKDNRSLLELSDHELCHIAEVADFACHSVSNYSVHMKQSSWDACLVATAALTLCVDSTLKDWSEQHSIHTEPELRPAEPTATTSSQPWPLSLLVESDAVPEDSSENFLRLPGLLHTPEARHDAFQSMISAGPQTAKNNLSGPPREIHHPCPNYQRRHTAPLLLKDNQRANVRQFPPAHHTFYRADPPEGRDSLNGKYAVKIHQKVLSNLVIGLITGHGHLRKHLHRVGILQEDPLCGRCNEQEETAEHLLFDCPAIARERYAIFGSLDRGGEFSQEDLIGCFRWFVELLKW
ncbi:hypothetical protein J6590_036334 [Homalodisca vitripennis]|nr:hypothetical protein J6590_036334 [Homalodisca vitripennis]